MQVRDIGAVATGHASRLEGATAARPRVTTIAPGIVLTPLLATLPEEVQASLGPQVPFPRRPAGAIRMTAR